VVGTVHLPSSVIMNIAASTEFPFPVGSIDAPSKSGFNQVKEPSHHCHADFSDICFDTWLARW